ncbi:capsular polysaccharide synthesis protein [Phocaeicola coprocola]|jgi:glycosyltransferase involved in cell wall biosynthesis|uniref:capsular polysaccharide synthesis protein n=1 Tax=Phocaeicola coprocola TaxID=310298 RepID=UPI0015B4BB6C
MKISVITISYNAASCIEDTIKSVINQTYKDFEYIIVDGNSNDGTVEIIQKYHPYISKWISEPDKGIYNAMNKAVRMANGEYCIFMNAGDIFCNPLVLKQVSLFIEDGFDYLIGNELSAKNGKIIDYVYPPQEITTQLFIKKSLSHQASFIKREMLLQYPYDETLKLVSDWKFCIQTLLLAHKTYRTIDVDVCIFNHEGITFTQKELGREERLKVIQDLLPEEVRKVHTRHNVFTRIQRRIICKKARYIIRLKKLRAKWQTLKSIINVLKFKSIPVLIGKFIGGHYGNKIKQDTIIKFIDKKYSYIIRNNMSIGDEKIQIKGKYPIWVCWWQGEKFMPLLPKICLQYLSRNLRNDQELHFISEENFSKYVQLPPNIIQMLHNGCISITHFSDILRFALLTKYGGLWIDSTCLVTKQLPDLSNFVFFTSKQYKSLQDNHYVSQYKWASYLIGGKLLSIFQNMRDLFYEYISHEKYIVDYFLLDYLLAEIYYKCKNAQKTIDQFPYDNYDILNLAQHLCLKYDKESYDSLIQTGCIHKLNRKMNYPIYTQKGDLTIWGSIINQL